MSYRAIGAKNKYLASIGIAGWTTGKVQILARCASAVEDESMRVEDLALYLNGFRRGWYRQPIAVFEMNVRKPWRVRRIEANIQDDSARRANIAESRHQFAICGRYLRRALAWDSRNGFAQELMLKSIGGFVQLLCLNLLRAFSREHRGIKVGILREPSGALDDRLQSLSRRDAVNARMNELAFQSYILGLLAEWHVNIGFGEDGNHVAGHQVQIER